MISQIYAVFILIAVLACVAVIALAAYLEQKRKLPQWSQTLYQAGLYTVIGIFAVSYVYAVLILGGVIK